MRTSRTNGSTTYSYVYNGSQLTQMTVGSNTLRFGYDTSGPLYVKYNGTLYYYVTNLQGDIVAIVNNSGSPVVEYTYDAWGKLLTTTGTLSSTLGVHNPLRYRGYVYDTETGVYYLQTRYYNPEMGRFINADVFASTSQGLLGNNMFAYCGNNPAIREDAVGSYWRYSIRSCKTEPIEESEEKTTYCTTITYDAQDLPIWGCVAPLTFESYSSTVELVFDVKNNGVITFDNSQQYANTLGYDAVRDKLAEEMLIVQIKQTSFALSGRTKAGISSELAAHYWIFVLNIPFVHDNAQRADMGGTAKNKAGYDSNAWIFDLPSILFGS